MKLWDVNKIKTAARNGFQNVQAKVLPIHTFRGHGGPLFALTTNNSSKGHREDTLVYSAGVEGVIRVWRVPVVDKNQSDCLDTLAHNNCLGVFSSHKDVVW